MDPKTSFLSGFLSRRRLARINEVLERRTRNVTLLLEDLYDPHNAAACIRTAEAFGLQEVHIVERTTKFQSARGVSVGAEKWVDLFRYPTPEQAVESLKSRGFFLAGASLAAGTTPLTQVDFTRPTAILLGAEHAGLSNFLHDACDTLFHIPMLGFTQSFNVSVAAGIILYHVVSERVAHFGRSGDLTPEDKNRLRAEWIRKSVRNVDLLLERFHANP